MIISRQRYLENLKYEELEKFVKTVISYALEKPKWPRFAGIYILRYIAFENLLKDFMSKGVWDEKYSILNSSHFIEWRTKSFFNNNHFIAYSFEDINKNKFVKFEICNAYRPDY